MGCVVKGAFITSRERKASLITDQAVLHAAPLAHAEFGTSRDVPNESPGGIQPGSADDLAGLRCGWARVGQARFAGAGREVPGAHRFAAPNGTFVT
jgi:hypothetical protein